MKKIFRALLICVASIIAVMGVAFCGLELYKENNPVASAEEQELGIVRIERDEAFKISSLEFFYQDAKVEFMDDGFLFSSSYYEIRVTISSGASSKLIEGCERSEDAGAGNTYYYLTQDEFVTRLGIVVTDYEFPYAVPANKNSAIKFDVVATIDEDDPFASNYFYAIRYSAVTSMGTNYTIFSPELDIEGNVSVGGTFDADSGLYKNTINGRTFKADFVNEDGGKLEFEIAEADNIILKLESASKAYPVFVNGERVVDGSEVTIDGVNVTTPVSVSAGVNANFVFVPTSGKLIKEVSLSVGAGHDMFTIYGGVCDEYPSAGLVYYFPKDVDTTGALMGVCGNYAFALISHDADYIYEFKPVSVTQTNYAEFEVQVEDGVTPTENQFNIRIYEDGRIKVVTSTSAAGVFIEMESQSFAQVNIKHTQKGENPEDEDLEDASSAGLESLKVNGVEVERVEGAIPKTLFILDFESTITITAKLKEHNNFYKMDVDKITGDIFEDTISVAGGVINIHTIDEETTFFRIELLNQDGSAYADVYTKIYIAVHEDESTLYSTEEELIANVVPSQMATTSGDATVEGLYSEYLVQYVIKISPYKIITDVDFNEAVLSYSNMRVSPEDRVGNTTVVFTVKNFEVERPVFHNGEKLGDVKITLLSYTQTRDGYNVQETAIYNCLFKQEGGSSYEALRIDNPYLCGYNFINLKLSDEADGFLTKFVDADGGYYGIESTSTDVHRMLSSKLYFAKTENPEEGDLFIEPVFESQLIEFEFSYKGDSYTGKAYFDDYKLYLNNVFDPHEEGRYLAGMKYTFLNSDVDWVKIVEVDAPVVVEAGEFAGMFMYELETPWKCHEPDALYEPQIDLRTFLMTIVSTDAEGNTTIIQKEIIYEMDFVVDDIEGVVAPIYPEEGVFNHIGWIEELDEEKTYYVTEDLEGFIKIKTSHTYLWEYDVRLIPVFSANVVSVRFYDGENLLESVNVKSNQIVTAEEFFIDEELGEFYTPSKFGYKFIGFERDGNLALKLEFDGYENFYFPILSGNEDIFKFVEPNFLWIASGNIDFYAQYEEIGYQLILEVEGTEFTSEENYTAQISGVDGEWTDGGDGDLTLSGFNITDQLFLSGFEPNSVDAYIAFIEFGYRVGEDVTYEAYEFITSCDADGVLSSVNNGTRFDEMAYTITLQVNELINDETQANAIYIRIKYQPVTFRIAFTANILKGQDDVLYNDPADTVYYKFTRENASIDKVDNWILCDESGAELGTVGWQNIVLPESGVVFMKNSLDGIAGIFFEDHNVTYSFKAWVDFGNNVILDSTTSLTKGYSFYSVFSDEFDVTVNYHIFNDSTGIYHENTIEGYFWLFDDVEEEYTLGDIKTANSFEIYLISGKLYYISHWTTRVGSTLITDVGGDDFAVRASYEVDYDPDAQTIDFYAVYTEYEVSVDRSGNTYTGKISVPNDANGNSYSSSDVFFIAVNKTTYDTWTESYFRPVDRLNSQFDTQEEIDDVKIGTISGSGVIIEPESLVNSYLFMVVQRKVDGENIPSFYLALMITT